MTLEQVFTKELNAAIRTDGYKDIYKIPLPKNNWNVSGAIMYGVNEVKDEYYKELNYSLVKRVPGGTKLVKRRIDKASRSFAKDEEGNTIYEEYTVPKGCVAVTSEVNLKLPYGYKSKEDFKYVDFKEDNGKVEYIYCIPKEYLFLVNQTALVLSVKNMKNYAGKGYKTWRNGTVFLHVVPYKPGASYIGSKVLKTGTSLDYSKEINEILKFWVMNGVIPDISLTQIATGENLITKNTQVGYESYTPIELLSIGEEELFGNVGETAE